MVTFSTPEEADSAIPFLNNALFSYPSPCGKINKIRQLEVSRWDGKTQYAGTETEAEASERLARWSEFIGDSEEEEEEDDRKNQGLSHNTKTSACSSSTDASGDSSPLVIAPELHLPLETSQNRDNDREEEGDRDDYNAKNSDKLTSNSNETSKSRFSPETDNEIRLPHSHETVDLASTFDYDTDELEDLDRHSGAETD
ncbi:unnamed protein product [Protopolystoma xenopodis]|uniref:Uncharacterized protein n=1 Tax=Protopolystoma xenopodis TaxID=117903 RepID=A0A448WBR5_9PLAT|nr:unnamed protein product [Protopolystoma xenopodis]